MSLSLSQFFASFWTGWTFTWPTALFAVIWAAWVISWAVGSLWAGRTVKRAAAWNMRAYRVPIVAGAILLLPWTATALGEQPLWDVGHGGTYALAAATLAGTLFTWWARLHLGRLWSTVITRKEGHRVIDTGPYALVRHPIYTGLCAGMLATAVAVATVTALLGAALIVFGLCLKARMEERFLMVELGPDAYGPYCRRVPMLVPFLPHH
jgi:protein-S-isoprenylcysteine O-methyltransferase Ste14